MNGAFLQDRFIGEQADIQKYVELLKYKTAILRTEVVRLGRILSKYGLWGGQPERNWLLDDGICTLEELQDAHDLLQSTHQRVAHTIAEVESELEALQRPLDLHAVDVRSVEGEWIEYMMEMLEHNASHEHIRLFARRLSNICRK